MSNDLRTAAQQALYALKAMQSYASDMKAGLRICDESIDQLYAALSLKQAEPQQAEPVAEPYAVQSAVLIEREACARLCESTTAAWTQRLYNEGCVDCAKAIRAQAGQDRAR